MCTSSVAPMQLCSNVLALLYMFVLLVPAQLFKYVCMYVVVVVVGVDWKDTYVCALHEDLLQYLSLLCAFLSTPPSHQSLGISQLLHGRPHCTAVINGHW